MQDYWSRVCFKPWGQERLRHLDILIFHPYLYFPVSALILLGIFFFFANTWGRGVLLFKRKWCTEGLPMVSMLTDNLHSADSGHGWLLVSHKFCSWLSEKIFIWNHLGLAVIALHNSQKMLKKYSGVHKKDQKSKAVYAFGLISFLEFSLEYTW